MLPTRIIHGLAKRTGLVPRAQYEAAVFVITDIATAEPKDAMDGGYGLTAQDMRQKCRDYLGLTDA